MLYRYVYIYMYMYMPCYIYMYIYMQICMYIREYIHMYTYKCTYIHSNCACHNGCIPGTLPFPLPLCVPISALCMSTNLVRLQDSALVNHSEVWFGQPSQDPPEVGSNPQRVNTRNENVPKGVELGFLPRRTPRSESQFTALPHKNRVTPRETGFKQGGWEGKIR